MRNTSANANTKTRPQGGFTLIELMIVLVIAAVLLAIGAPGLGRLLERNRIQTDADTIFASLMLSRSEALKRNQPVVMCKSSDGAACVTSGHWSQGWMIYADRDSDGGKDPNEPILAVTPAFKGGVTIRAAGGFANEVTYRVDGSAAAQGTFVLCNSAEDTSSAKEVIVSVTGRPRVNKTTTDCTP